jgi:glutaredoxin-like protein NrdH
VEAIGRVPGRGVGSHRTKFYGLSTCVWCKKTRQLLEELGAEFDFVYVDLVEGDDLKAVLAELARLGRGETFPTLVIDGADCIVGFKPDEIRRALGS